VTHSRFQQSLPHQAFVRGSGLESRGALGGTLVTTWWMEARERGKACFQQGGISFDSASAWITDAGTTVPISSLLSGQPSCDVQKSSVSRAKPTTLQSPLYKDPSTAQHLSALALPVVGMSTLLFPHHCPSESLVPAIPDTLGGGPAWAQRSIGDSALDPLLLQCWGLSSGPHAC
jgi:hypothetical protein